MLEQIKILQHNVIKWTYKRRNELYNCYIKENPDIIILNATGQTDQQPIKLFNYKVYQRNKESEEHAGIAIAVRYNIKHKIHDDYNGDVLAVEVETNRGQIIIATTYWPPRRDIAPLQDILRIIRKRIPAYILGDFNARHPFIGHTRSNNNGRIINNLINNNLIDYIGPEFPTLVYHRAIGRPDMILSNKNCFMNYSIKEGELTTSDHIPVIMTLATKPIVKANREIYQFHKTDWDKFKEVATGKLLEHERQNDRTNRPKNKEYIETEIEEWHNIIKQTKEEVVPKKTIQTNPPSKRE